MYMNLLDVLSGARTPSGLARSAQGRRDDRRAPIGDAARSIRANRKDADKSALARPIDVPTGELTAIDPARAVAIA
ncbi:hypothetical protein QYH69_08350 [Paraburkholderia sp. SARCC-3016]|jgi:hypothetical protein|uniref:hypothetical protein n=1 Tax=Paraburkholderia sp. SARCC-3016 TaxID=3058611 RepID=UPI0028092D8C|nr:hypothetical protein [Paraburkholderia sp. SARCC-3016]MDQ7977256.1 hypothetical protein [Paraburkholderia sp. SARCC-3016]